VACSTDPEQKHRFSLDNTVYGNRAIAVSVSPDGKYLLTRYWDNHSLKRSRTYCELTELKTGKVLLTNLRDGMRWMPKSNKLYYTVVAPEGNDVITLDPVTLKEEVLLRGIPEQGFSWSPNEDFLIYYPREEGVKDEGPLKRIVSPADRIPDTRGRSFLARYDIASGTSERLTYGNHSTYMQDISPDGKYLLYSSSKENITQRPFSLSSLFQVNLETLAVDTLFFEDRFLGGASYSPDGKQLLLTASPEAFDGIGKNCGQTQPFSPLTSTLRHLSWIWLPVKSIRSPKNSIRLSTSCNGTRVTVVSTSAPMMYIAGVSIAIHPKIVNLKGGQASA